MPRLDLVRESPVERTSRVIQLEGLFDVPPSRRTGERWHVDIDLPPSWQVGLIVGPSGSGKSTIARALFGDAVVAAWAWPEAKSIIDGFPAQQGIKEITNLLSAVGFSSPPAWLRPYAVLSTGEQFRVNLARTLAEMPELAVIDEFTSVVDRTVAKIGSAAIAKAVRRRGQRFVAVSCHADIAEWLEPDWTYEPHLNRFARDRLQRPGIQLCVDRVTPAAWSIFRRHHYLDTNLNPSAVCFIATWNGALVAFSSWLSMPSGTVCSAWREHRTVCLPDYQGVGIGNALSDYCASMLAGLGRRVFSKTGHPGMVRSRARSSRWTLVKNGSFSSRDGGSKRHMTRSRATTRLAVGFRYVGPAMPRSEAERTWGT